MTSDVGLNVGFWGPRSAGLYEEVNGVRKFKDPELDDVFKNNKPYDPCLKYGLIYNLTGQGAKQEQKIAGVLPMVNNIYGIPDFVYKKNNSGERNPANYGQAFSPAMVDPYQNKLVAKVGNVWDLVAGDKTPLMKDAWAKRKIVDDAIVKCITGVSDEKFDAVWADLQKAAKVQAGFNEETLAEINNYYFNDLNANFKSAFQNN